MADDEKKDEPEGFGNWSTGLASRLIWTALILILFITVGSPVGTAIWLVWMAPVVGPEDAANAVDAFYFGSALLAAASGLLIGIREVWFRPATFVFALLTVLTIAIPLVFALEAEDDWLDLFGPREDLGVVLVIFGMTITPWLLLKLWHKMEC